MNSLLPFLAPVLIILILVIRRAPKSSAYSAERPDFIRKASESIHGAEVQVPTFSSSEAPEGVDYNYDVVGESFNRDRLTALIRAHKAFDQGEIYSTAVLELEPENEFDPNAVKVLIEGSAVGHIPKIDSPTVTEMIKKRGKNSIEVPACIGWDTDSPEPLIGVRLALTVE